MAALIIEWVSYSSREFGYLESATRLVDVFLHTLLFDPILLYYSSLFIYLLGVYLRLYLKKHYKFTVK